MSLEDRLVDAVSAVLYKHDPENIADITDEYDPEAQRIVTRLLEDDIPDLSIANLTALTYSVFAEMFGGVQSYKGVPIEKFIPVAEDISEAISEACRHDALARLSAAAQANGEYDLEPGGDVPYDQEP